MNDMVTTQIRCPHCGKRANDVVYSADAPHFMVQTLCWNRRCRRHYTTPLPYRA
jgi:C4-type Zn-finger protein